jgi:hypothetical protein
MTSRAEQQNWLARSWILLPKSSHVYIGYGGDPPSGRYYGDIYRLNSMCWVNPSPPFLSPLQLRPALRLLFACSGCTVHYNSTEMRTILWWYLKKLPIVYRRAPWVYVNLFTSQSTTQFLSLTEATQGVSLFQWMTICLFSIIYSQRLSCSIFPDVSKLLTIRSHVF